MILVYNEMTMFNSLFFMQKFKRVFKSIHSQYCYANENSQVNQQINNLSQHHHCHYFTSL